MINRAILTNELYSFQAIFALLNAYGDFSATFIGLIEEIENSENLIRQICSLKYVKCRSFIDILIKCDCSLFTAVHICSYSGIHSTLVYRVYQGVLRKQVVGISLMWH